MMSQVLLQGSHSQLLQPHLTRSIHWPNEINAQMTIWILKHFTEFGYEITTVFNTFLNVLISEIPIFCQSSMCIYFLDFFLHTDNNTLIPGYFTQLSRPTHLHIHKEHHRGRKYWLSCHTSTVAD